MPVVPGSGLGSGQELIHPLFVEILLRLPLPMFPLGLSSFLTVKLLLLLDLSPKVGLICRTDLSLTAGTDINDEFKGQNR